MNLATPGTIVVEIDESKRELILTLLAPYFDFLMGIGRQYPEVNVAHAWNEATRLKELIEGPLPRRGTP